MQGILPGEAQRLLSSILEEKGEIGDQVEQVLLKLWQGEQLTEEERNLDITSAEVAALWSITHQRPIKVAAVRQAVSRRKGAWKEPIAPSKEWGSGPTKRRLFRLGDVVAVQVQKRSASEKSAAQ